MTKHTLDPNQWIDNYADYLFNYTISRVSDREMAQDLVQDTFFAGLKSMKNFKGEANERTWLVSILKRKIIDHYRKINFSNSEDEEGDWLEQRVADPFDKTAEDTLENEELGSAIYKCLEKIPKKQADIFKMKTILSHDTESICNEFDITPSNLWVIIHRARTSLASCLENDWFN